MIKLNTCYSRQHVARRLRLLALPIAVAPGRANAADDRGFRQVPGLGLLILHGSFRRSPAALNSDASFRPESDRTFLQQMLSLEFEQRNSELWLFAKWHTRFAEVPLPPGKNYHYFCSHKKYHPAGPGRMQEQS